MAIVSYFKALSDETRLRLFNLLWHHELSVNEIVSLMGMGQSRISRHLKILSDSGLLTSRRDGLWVFYRAQRNGNAGGITDKLEEIVRGDTDLRDDLERLGRMLSDQASEKTRFFDSLAPRWDVVKAEIVGEVDLTREIVSCLSPCSVASDLGCGTGELLLDLKSVAEKVIGVDRSPRMLEEARKRLGKASDGIELRIGEIEHLPMREGESDAAVANMVLHHLSSPRECIREMARVVRGGGVLIIADLDKHENEEMRRRFGHRWLGFDRKEMERWLVDAGFRVLEVRMYPARNGLAIALFKAVRGEGSR